MVAALRDRACIAFWIPGWDVFPRLEGHHLPPRCLWRWGSGEMARESEARERGERERRERERRERDKGPHSSFALYAPLFTRLYPFRTLPSTPKQRRQRERERERGGGGSRERSGSMSCHCRASQNLPPVPTSESIYPQDHQNFQLSTLHHPSRQQLSRKGPGTRGGLARVNLEGKLAAYGGTSRTRKRTPLGPYRRPLPRVLGGF